MGVPGIKAALELLGLHGGEPRPPFSIIPEVRIDEIRSILEAADLLTTAGV